ncbi:lysophospholipid acyltransferase family protein [Sphingobacterium pedocola]|uniref:Lipid A biosynthesis acyltransferase n=1 Tax=Sphingobacterium pedocola TaxID=2082722 RepID=A0ABR9TD32_9SPHI|nr:hypothetical protein [Sphingobacterium pedocola]MBE8722974.1 hypothetical protein [Sphingobacterium pedocola]
MNQEYINAICQLQERHRNTNYVNNPEFVNGFGLFSGALYHLMPHLDYQKHADLYRDYLFQSHWAALDMSYFLDDDPFVVDGLDQLLANLRQGSPSIIASFHYGSYRLLPYLLQKHDIPFCLLVRRKVRTQQIPFFQSLNGTHRSQQLAIKLLDAEDPLAALKVRRMLRDGCHVLSYLDGIQAIQHAEQHKCPSISIMAGKIKIREGLPRLAAKFKTDMIAVFTARNGMTGHTIHAQKWTAAQLGDGSPVSVMQDLFCWFEGILNKDPMAWENWGSMHHLLQLKADRVNDPNPQFDPEKSSLLAFGTSYFVLDKNTLKSYKIDEKLFKRLRQQWLATITSDS